MASPRLTGVEGATHVLSDDRDKQYIRRGINACLRSRSYVVWLGVAPATLLSPVVWLGDIGPGERVTGITRLGLCSPVALPLVVVYNSREIE